MKKDALISLVDDDQFYKFAAKIQFQRVGHLGDIIDFDHGEAALEFILNNISDPSKLPDCIFLDINMPIMDGFEFIKEFIQIKSRIGKPIVIYMVSSSRDTVDSERAEAISAISDFIIKPLSIDCLQEILQKL